MVKPRVDILLPTYNGEKYLAELLDSLVTQTYTNIHILIRDDQSTDGTVCIVEKYAKLYADRIEIISDDRGNLGVTNNMFCLLSYSSGKYIMFCDQDDVWMKNKVGLLVHAIRIKEREYPNTPILVHADAINVDESLNPIRSNYKKSLTSFQLGRDKRKNSFEDLLYCNIAQGASMIINQSLREMLIRLSNVKLQNSPLYDSIISSVCSIKGKIFFLPKPLMLYRQHGGNALGCKRRYLWLYPFYGQKDKDEVLTIYSLQYNRKKGDLLKKYYSKELSKNQIQFIRNNGKHEDILMIHPVKFSRWW